MLVADENGVGTPMTRDGLFNAIDLDVMRRGGRRPWPPLTRPGMVAAKNILVVEDEVEIRELVRYNLAKEGFQVRCADCGEVAIRTALRAIPDLVVLDLMLPGMDGFAVCRLLPGDPRTQDIPIVMLTAKGKETDIVAGLELGADDYVTKPFSPRILVARVYRRARRSGASQNGLTMAVHSSGVIRT